MANDKTYDRHINIWINGKEVKNDVSSIKKEMFQLQNQLAKTTRGTEEYNQKAAELRKIKAILKEHQDTISATGGAWTKIKGLFSSAQGMIVAGIGALTAGYQSLKGIITSTDALSDKFEITLSGWKSGLDAVARAIATLDFKNLGKNIKNAIEEGRRYAEQLDQIDDKTRALKIQESEAANELLKQREIQNDVRKSMRERNDAGREAIALEEKLAGIRTQIGKQAYENEAENIAQITHLTQQEVLAYASQDPVMMKNIENGREYNKLLEEKAQLEREAQGEMGILALTKEQIARYEEIRKILPTVTEDTKRFAYAAVNMPGDEKMQLFVDKYVAYQQAIGSGLENTLKIRSKQAKTEKELLEEQIAELTRVTQQALENPAYNADAYIEAEARKIAETEKKINEERVKDAQDTENKKVEALIEAGQRGKEEAIKTWNEIKENDRRNIEESVMAYAEYGARIGEMVGDAISEGIVDAREAAKQLVLIALDELGNFATLAIARATVDSLIQGDSIATFGATGLARAAILSGLIKAAIGAAKGVISKNLYTGGYSGPGDKYAPAGIVHGGEWVANKEMVSSPVTGPIIQALENMRTSPGAGFYDGGMATGSGQQTGGSGRSAAIVATDPELKQLVRMNIALNKMLLRDGVRNVWPWKEVDNMRKGMSKLEGIEGDVSL